MHDLLAQSLCLRQAHWEVTLAVQQLEHLRGKEPGQARCIVVPRPLLGVDV